MITRHPLHGVPAKLIEILPVAGLAVRCGFHNHKGLRHFRHSGHESAHRLICAFPFRQFRDMKDL